jgi:hypothetical protein
MLKLSIKICDASRVICKGAEFRHFEPPYIYVRKLA